MLVDQGTAAGDGVQAEVADLLFTVREPEIFELRLFALARQAAVLNGVQLARLARAHLPKRARILRFVSRRVLWRLHLSAAVECDEAGYARMAATHLVRGALLEPTILLRRRSIGILARFLVGRNARNRLIRTEVASIFRLLDAHGVQACIFGSLAISLCAGRFVKRHGDVDLVFSNEADTTRAATLLVDELKYRVYRRHDWIGLTGERCFHVALRAPSGIPIELSYLPENPSVKEHVRVVNGVAVRTVDLRGLRDIYALFLLEKAAASHDLEKQSKKSAILTIDRLLSAEGHSKRLRGPGSKRSRGSDSNFRMN